MLEPSQIFSHFKIIRKIGEGGMGAVYLAEDLNLSRQVALKILTSDVFDDSERHERFRREAKTAAQVTHPNVMSIFEIGSASPSEGASEVNFIVMEYIEGKSLSGFITSEKPEMSQLVRLAEKIAGGLAAAHQLNIVHRDIKPDNIIVSANGDPKILDFGLAKPVATVGMNENNSTATVSQELTRAGKIIGTIKYMSPEQVQGKNVDNRSDIFSFGILLYTMFTGETPFQGQTQVSTLAKILETPHEAPRSKNDAIPPELERIIDKCLRKDRSDRYQDTRDLVVDLRNHRRQSDSGVTGALSGVTNRLSGEHTIKAKISNWWLMLPVAVVAILIAVLYNMSLFSFDINASSGGDALAIIGFENKTGDSEYDWLETGLPEILLTDLSQNNEVKIVSQQRIIDCFDVEKKNNHTFAECAKAAQSLGAGRILSGSFYKLGDKIRIDARLEDIETGNIILGEKVVGTDPMLLVDSLISKIAAKLNIDKSSMVSTNTLSTPEAFKQYHLGMALFWANEFDSAIARFDQAIALDSGFALPFMRIGMAHKFENRNAQGVRYFKMARDRQDRLPIRERNILDAYIDTWVDSNFDDAFTKLRVLLRDYPEDGEIRTMYAMFVNVFQQDTVTAHAHMDTVLATYPTYAFALEQYATMRAAEEDYEGAEKLAQQLVASLPNSLGPKINLILIHQFQHQYQEAFDIAKTLHDQFPYDVRPLRRLVSNSVHLRNLADARQYVEILREADPEDVFNKIVCEQFLANIDVWEGKFHSSMDHQFRTLELAHETDDSLNVFGTLNSIADYYRRFEMPDSMITYEEQAFNWAQLFNKISYPMQLVMLDPANEAKARPIFEAVIKDFRTRLPEELWAYGEGLEEMFEAYIVSDTAALIVANRKVNEAVANARENIFQFGELLVNAGEFSEGRETLEILVTGRLRTNNAYMYQVSTYLLGVAAEGEGDTKRAIKLYSEFLDYWANADIQIKYIKEAKVRLARLTS